MKGKIRKLVRERGFGFINAEDGREIFFHRSDLDGTYFGLLEDGNDVEFDVERGSRGFRAVNIRRVQNSSYEDFTQRADSKADRRFDVHARFDSLERQSAQIYDQLEELSKQLNRIHEHLEQMQKDKELLP